MKHLAWILPFFLFLVACGETEGETENNTVSKNITVKGSVTNGENAEVLLMAFEGGKEVLVDSAVVTNGSFELNTKTNELREYIVLVGREEMPVIFFADESSTEIVLNGAIPGFGENYTISGCKSGVEIREYLDFLKPYYQTEQVLYAQLNSTAPNDTNAIKSIMFQLDSIAFIQRDYAIEHINADPSSPTSWLLLRELFPASGLLAFDSSDLGYFEKVADAMREKYPYSEYPGFIDKDIVNVQSQIAAMNNPQPQQAMPSGMPGIGEMAPEINLNGINGQPLALSSLRGNVVLIDFWASWCKPCRMENPNVVKLYNQYRTKGFTVYSVSLDEDKAAWEKAIQTDNLTWPNHVSDLQGWYSAAAADYGVQSIPSTFLIDKKGVIIGTNLRGAQLEQKLQEVLG